MPTLNTTPLDAGLAPPSTVDTPRHDDAPIAASLGIFHAVLAGAALWLLAFGVFRLIWG